MGKVFAIYSGSQSCSDNDAYYGFTLDEDEAIELCRQLNARGNRYGYEYNYHDLSKVSSIEDAVFEDLKPPK